MIYIYIYIYIYIVVDFLDITLDLRTGNYKPYKKPNDCINYIHKEMNRPPATIKKSLKEY